MPKLLGMDERKAAFKRVSDNLKEITAINTSLEGVSRLTKDGSLSADYEVTITFSTESDTKRFKCPLSVDNPQFILDSMKKYKQSIVNQIRSDCAHYDIELSVNEEADLSAGITTE